MSTSHDPLHFLDFRCEMEKRINVAERKRRIGLLTAVAMLFAFSVVLGTVYVEHRGYHYTSSYVSLMAALQKEELVKINQSAEIWDWIDRVVTSIGGTSIDSVNANCAYSTFNTQIVTIDSKQYTLEYPFVQMQSCSENNLPFIQGSADEVYLIGNHQLLIFGLFSQRGGPRFPLKKAVKDAKHSQIKVRQSQSELLNPLVDDKIIELCRVSWTPEATPSFCVLKDAFESQAGTTLGWGGTKVQGSYAFTKGSSAFIVSSELASAPIEVLPCYTFEEQLEPTSQPTPAPGAPSVR
jgi:hypothetical protein